MEIFVQSRSQDRAETIEALCKFYARELNINKLDFTLAVQSKRNLGSQASVSEILPKILVMEVDSSIGGEQLLTAIAHEMVHVKQMLRGQLKKKITKRGKVELYWLGKLCKKDYYEQPWEIEAFRRQTLLSNKVVQRLIKKGVAHN